MTWKITKVFVNATDDIAFEVTNTSGVSQSTSDLYAWGSDGLANTAGPIASLGLYGAPASVPAGGTFVFGDSDVAEVSGSFVHLGAAVLDFYGFGTISTLIDGVGDADSAVSPWTTNTIFTADPSRTADTDASDAFSFATDFTSSTYCFAAGTQITGPDGEVCVEALTIGDVIQTATGDLVPIKWIGRQTLHKWRHGPHMQPVRIRAGALGNGLPHSDLTVTADHGMILDGLVINASALVNGTTIDWVPMDELDDSFTVYHIETQAHSVILANGAPAETFMDAAGRAAFDNHQEYLDLYGTERIIPEAPMPRISARRLVPQVIKTRLGSDAASKKAA